jgi:hypothetical protein
VGLAAGGCGCLVVVVGLVLLGVVLVQNRDATGPAPPAARAASTTRPRTLSESAYMQLYLDRADLPAGLERTQDSRRGMADKEAAFAKYRGQRSGLSVWTTKNDRAALWRLVDIRWTFATPADAAAYHAATASAHAEGAPEIRGAPLAGSECRVHGGTTKMAGVTLKHYYYLFRVGSVVVKLYGAEGQNARGALDPRQMKAIAERVVARIEKHAR